MKTILKLSILLLIFCISGIIKGQNENFRKTDWGFSKKAVMDLVEAKPIAEGVNFLTYKYELASMPCEIKYNFSNEGKLMNGKYIFKIENEDYEKCISDYNFFKQLLIEKYHAPVFDKMFWLHEPTEKSEVNWGNNLAQGNLSFKTQWKMPKTVLQLTLNSLNNQIYLIITYTSTEIKENLSPGDLGKIKAEL